MASDKSKLKILLLSYTFPPTPGIGGRRWAKFCKYLTNDDIEFHVIHSNSSPFKGDFWRDDIENNSGIVTYPINFRFNNFIGNKSLNFFQKILYKMIIFWAKLTNLNPYDNSSYSEKIILKKANDIVEKNKIKTVIVTGPPFHLFYIGSKLKYQLDLKLIIDYRDMWNVYHLNTTSADNGNDIKEKYAIQREREVLDTADEVWSVNEGMKRNLIALNNNQQVEKFHTVPNGYDKSDFYLNIPKNKQDKIRLFFAGNIVRESFELVKNFVNAFQDLKDKYPKAYAKFEMTIYCKNVEKELSDFLKIKSFGNFKFINGFIPRDEYYLKLRNIDIGLVFLKEIYKDAFITKFSDYILNKNYIIYIGSEGDFSDYLKSKGIGRQYRNEGCDFFQTLLFDDLESAYKNYRSDDFNLENISKNILEKLKARTIETL